MDMGVIEVRAQKGATQERVAGRFGQISEDLARRCAEAAQDVADRIAIQAWSNRNASPYQFTIFIAAEGGGTHYDVNAAGQWAQMLEEGSPRHNIGAPGKWLVNETSGGHGSHWPDPMGFKTKRQVSHPGLQGIHYLRRAADSVDAVGVVIQHIGF